MVEKVGSKAVRPNPALKVFEPLVGEWETTGSHPYFSSVELHGRTVFEWIEGGAFLMMRSQIDYPEFPDGLAILGSDDQAGTYVMMYFDERGISRKQDIAVADGEIKWWRDDPKFSQRFTIHLKGDTMESYGEMSRDGGSWEKDLSLVYKKVGNQEVV
jgi:hypothetical protein